MMNKLARQSRLFRCLPWVVLTLTISAGIAQSQEIKRDVLCAAGNVSQSVNFRLFACLGQPAAIGQSSSEHYELGAGFLGRSGETEIMLPQTHHFAFAVNTGAGYSIFVTAAKIDGVSLVAGDEIGVFTEEGLCVGGGIWSGAIPFTLTAWRDDPGTPQVDGFMVGSGMVFRFWQQDSDTEMSAVPSYSQGNGTFGDGDFTTASLAASGVSAVYGQVKAGIPGTFNLTQNYPNPFNSGTVISYQLPQPGKVLLTVYNMLGQEVVTLIQQEQEAGFYQARWSGRDELGRPVPSGVYLYRLVVGDYSATQKAIYAK